MKITTILHRIILSVLIVSFFSACGGGENNVTIGNREGILHWGNGDEPQELDPHIITGVPEHHLMIALLEGLVLKDPNTLEPIPGVAESWTISDDGTVYTFKIRDNARWSNGDALTAEDFRWSWERSLLPALGNQYSYMAFPIINAQAFSTGELTDFSQVGVKVLDKLTLEVTLNNPTPYFLQLLDHYSMFPVHRATIEKHGEPGERGTRWTRVGSFVGNGPFILKQWDLNKVLIVEKSPTYWDRDTVKLNGIYFHPTQNITTEERMFRAGQLHYTNVVPPEKILNYRENNPESLHVSPYLGTYFYRINTRVKHLSDVRVRKALALSIDRKSLVKNVTKAGEIPAYTFTPPNTLGYTANSSESFNPDKARALLAEAGYPEGVGFPATEILYNTHEGHRKLAVAIQQMWKKELNIEIKLLNQDWKVYLDTETSGNYEISRAGWIGDYVDPNTFLDLWLKDGGNNRTGWSNEEYERLVFQEAPQAKTQEARYEAFRKAEQILLDEMPIILVYTYVSKHLVHPSVKGLPGNLMDYPSYKNMYLSDEPQSDLQ